ncbi:MAG: LpxI family protein [Thermoguttaceae bacterium]
MQYSTSALPQSHQSSPAPARIGLMAGWGRYPLLVVEALRRQGSEVYCLGVVGHADPKLAEICQDFQWSGLGRFGAAIRYFKRHAVTDVIMAGKIHKVVLFKPWMIVRNTPDLRTIRMFIPHFLTHRKDNKDDTLLGAIVQEFAREGMRFGRPTDYAAELLVSKGQLTRRGPSAWQWKDIRFGWNLAKEMGRLDVGQSVVVKDQAVLAIEAVEGTDECIRRAGLLCSAGGFSVVKVAKPQQDMRYDVPTVGMRTVENIASSGGRVLAIEAGRTILLDGPQVIDFADRHGLVIVAID